MENLEQKIIETIKHEESEVDNWNDAVFMSEYNVLTENLVKLFDIHCVSKQRELLIAFHKFQQNNWSSPNAEITENVVNVFLKSNL